MGIGECTPLLGYNWEDIGTDLNALLSLIPALIGLSSDDARKVVLDHQKATPFAMSSLLCALDLTDGNVDLPWDIPAFRFIKSMDISDERHAMSTLEAGIEDGFNCFKVKIGKNIEQEVAVLNSILSFSPRNTLLRCDANKALSYSEALNFAQKIRDPEGIEYIEQPFAEACWDDHARFQKNVGIPVALDESVYYLDDVKKAFESKACKTIKLKLMKHGGLKETIALGKKAQQLGLNVVLGNGVQTDWGCYLEAVLFNLLRLDSGGEMVGFFKQKESLLKKRISIQDGKLVFGDNRFKMEEFLPWLMERKREVFSFS